MLTERERAVLTEIKHWEEELFQPSKQNIGTIFDEWIEQSFAKLPEHLQDKFFKAADEWLFQLQSIIQSSQFQQNAEQRILETARLYDETIESIDQMQNLHIDKLQYIANEQITRHRLYSLAQGSLTGTGKPLFLGFDIPAIAVINIRVVQLISLCYGYKLTSPYDIIAALKCFHGGILPNNIKKEAWSEIVMNLDDDEDHYFYDGNEDLMSIHSVQQPIKQLFKLLVIRLFRKKDSNKIPFLSIAIGGTTNYKLTKDITDFAHNYYKYRHLSRLSS